jgi:hypothetical protein
MNMTKLGKTLVLSNLVLSVVFVAWAVGLATNQVPWATPPGGGTQVQGLVEQLNNEIKRLTPAQQAADTNWAAAYVLLKRHEAELPTNRKFYQDMLKSARQGGVPGINPPVQQLQFGADGQLVIKPSGRPVEINGQPALPIQGYNQAIQDTLQKIQQAQAEVKRLTEETEKLTTQINGTKPRDQAVTAAEKGLRVQLAEQVELIKSLQLEAQYLHSPLIYTTLQTAQLKRRQAELSARLDELNKATTAVGRKP